MAIQPTKNLLPILGVPVCCLRSPDKAFLTDGYERSVRRELEAISQGRFTFPDQGVRGEAPGHDHLLGRIHLTNLAPFVELAPIRQLDGDAPAPLRPQLRSPILQTVDAGDHPLVFDFARHHSAKSLFGSSG